MGVSQLPVDRSAANPPACRVYHNATQNMATAANTALAFNQERHKNVASMHDNATNNSRITIPVAGLYLITGHVAWGSTNDWTYTNMWVLRNGATTIAYDENPSSSSWSLRQQSIATVYKFAAGDYVQLWVVGARTPAAQVGVVVLADNSPEFSATWIGLG